MKNLFITATGTDIGKTWLACALLRHWRAQGALTAALKPVLSGLAVHDAASLTACDAGQLLAAQGQAVTAQAVAAIAPWRFAAPRSPDQAALAEGRTIDFMQLLTFCRAAAPAHDVPAAREDGAGCRATKDYFSAPRLVEGVGGVMVPLDATHTVLDWMAALDWPVLLVAGTYLGAMSHTLTALLALHSRGLTVAAVALNETPGSPVALADTAHSLQAHVANGAAVPVVSVSRAAPGPGIAELAHILHPFS